jgi:rsbT co-antagonist protein RsbR
VENTPAVEQATAHLETCQETLVSTVRAALQEHLSTNRTSLPPHRLDETSQAVVAAFRRFAAYPQADVVQEYGAKLSRDGLSLPSVTAVMTALRRTCRETLPNTKSGRQTLGVLLDTVDRYEAAFLAGWVMAAEQRIRDEQEQTRRALDTGLRELQESEARLQRTISELSSPVIQVWEGVLVLPLVGAIDSERARRMTEDLLNGIVTHQAEQVIIDITGVPVVDTSVANHLLQTIKAARLLGARCLLVGISSEVAQAMVHLGIDLSGVATRANLQAGIEYVMAQMGLGVAPLGPEA